tara:strand:- start:7 stop:240 length:234 start_codon:yes stop_codon:yes gene_type:complete
MYQQQNLGAVTGQTLGMSTIVVLGGIAAFAVGGVVQTAMNEYFIGMKRTKTYKTIAKRNAVLGGAIGAVAAAGILAA